MSTQSIQHPPRAAVVSDDVIERARDAYHRGRHLDVVNLLGAPTVVDALPSTEARVLMGRVVRRLGHTRLGRWWMLEALRRDRSSAIARYYAAADRVNQGRGWSLARRLLGGRTPNIPEPADDRARAMWLALAGQMAGLYRDFDRGLALYAQAAALSPADPWPPTCRALLLAEADRVDEGLDAIKQLVAQMPTSHLARMVEVYLLSLRGDADAALARLTDIEAGAQDFRASLQLGTQLFDLDRHVEARAAFERARRHAPLAEPAVMQMLHGRLCDVTWRLGEVERSRFHARRAGAGFFTEIAKRVGAHVERGAPPNERRRVQLDVPFVPQKHDTCAPATLTALVRTLGGEADHDEVAARICYDGTPSHVQRTWAQGEGYVVREFVATWEASVALLDIGLPFALRTDTVDSAHLVAITGYDAVRGTLVVRDPSNPSAGEFLASGLFETHAASGPLAAVLVPAERRAEVEALDLPLAPVLDRIHAIEVALYEHRPDEARAELDAIVAAHPELADQPLLRLVQMACARHDGDEGRRIEHARRLTHLFPDCDWARAVLLRALAGPTHHGEWKDRLEFVAGRKNAHPYFLTMLADALDHDPTTRPRAETMVRRALRLRPNDGLSMHVFGDICASLGRDEESFLAHRLSVTLNPTDEHYAETAFHSACRLGRRDAGLALLGRRIEKLGRLNAGPATTLCVALESIGQRDAGLQALEEQDVRRPEDSQLRLYWAGALSRAGRFDEAQAHLEWAQGRTRREGWLAAAADIAERRGAYAEATAHTLALVELEPQAVATQSRYTRLVAKTRGLNEALAHIERASRARPRDLALLQLWDDWLDRADRTLARLPVVRRMVEVDPRSAWSWRQLGFVAVELGHLEEAARAVKRAMDLDPKDTATLGLHGMLAAAEGDLDAAQKWFRAAVEGSPDYEWGQRRLLEVCSDDPALQREALAFIEGRLVQSTSAGGFDSFGALVRRYLGMAEALAATRRLREARPEVYDAVLSELRSLQAAGEPEPLIAAAERAIERFSSRPDLFMLLAEAHHVTHDRQASEAAARRALAVDPTYAPAWCHVGMLHEEAGDLDAAEEVYRDAIDRAPLAPQNYGYLAEVLWKKGEVEGAMNHLERALEVGPEYTWAMSMLVEWGGVVGRSEEGLHRLEALAARSPHDGATQAALAQAYLRAERYDAALAAAERARCAEPRNPQRVITQVEALVRMGRADDAQALCAATVDDIDDPDDVRVCWAQIHADKGDMGAAIDKVRAVVDADPDNAWAWRNLASFIRQKEGSGAAADAAARWSELEPNNPTALAGVADALAATGQTSDALARLEQALVIDPEHSWAAGRYADLSLANDQRDKALAFARAQPKPDALLVALADAHINRGSRSDADGVELHDAAAESCIAEVFKRSPNNEAAWERYIDILERQNRHAELWKRVPALAERPDASTYLLARAARLAAAQGDTERLVAWTRRTLEAPYDGHWPIHTAITALQQAGAPVESLCDDVAASAPEPTATAIRCALVTALIQGAALDDAMRRVDAWSHDIDAHVEELGAAVDAFVDFERPHRILPWCNGHADDAARHLRLWTACARVRLIIDPVDATAWMSDWRERDGVEMWMVYNVCTALSEAGRDEEALSTEADALARLDPDHTVDDLRALHAAHLAGVGKLDAARHQLEKINAEALDTRGQAWRAVAHALVDEPPDWFEAVDTVALVRRDVEPTPLDCDVLVKVCRRILRDAPRWGLRLSAWWHGWRLRSRARRRRAALSRGSD